MPALTSRLRGTHTYIFILLHTIHTKKCNTYTYMSIHPEYSILQTHTILFDMHTCMQYIHIHAHKHTQKSTPRWRLDGGRHSPVWLKYCLRTQHVAKSDHCLEYLNWLQACAPWFSSGSANAISPIDALKQYGFSIAAGPARGR